VFRRVSSAISFFVACYGEKSIKLTEDFSCDFDVDLSAMAIFVPSIEE
jgi:hypothetical protein